MRGGRRLPLLLLVFLLVCARYASLIHLWGDETYSLNLAARDWPSILGEDPFHLPTYYFLLHPFVGLFPPGTEIFLRLCHVLIFVIGLVFCWRIAQSLLGRGWALWIVIGLTILLPNYIFYATNIRMYAPLFAVSLAFLWTAFRLLEPGGAQGRTLIWHLLTALLCAALDLPGLLLVAFTWLALILLRGRSLINRLPLKRWGIAWLAVLALLTLVLFHDPIRRVLLAWPSVGAMAPGSLTLRAFAKSLFFQIRPALDLVYPPDYPLVLNAVIWLLLIIALPIAAIVLWRQGDASERLVTLLASYWLVGSPLGLSVTRAFLPAQFFMLLMLALALQQLHHHRRTWGCLLALALSVVGLANVQQVISPTLRLYSRIPYPLISRQALSLASVRRIPRIAVSRHTLNALSIERFALPLLAPSQQLLLLDSRPECASFPRGTFVYVQLMEEDGEQSDPRRACQGQARVQVTPVQTYVDFDDLAYNPLWSSSLRDRGGQEVAARLEIVTVIDPAHATAPRE